MIKDTKLSYALNVVSRWVVGLVFLFSSFVKGVDPMGTIFKVQEYMSVWTIGGHDFAWAQPLAAPISIVMIAMEFLVGVLLITNASRRFSAWLLMLMMLFFTATTLVDAISNKVSDCGCFGDAVKLTNWQTFWKNVALDVFAVVIVLTRNVRRKRRFERDAIIFIFAVVVMVIFEFYNMRHEPIIDFRPWKVGNRMMETHAEQGVKSYLVYRNTQTGEVREFDNANFMEFYNAEPDFNSKWEFVESRVEDPNEIKADGFSMLDIEGSDHATDLLPAEDGLLVVTVYNLGRLGERDAKEIAHAVAVAEENGTKIVMLTSALPEEVQAWVYDNHISGLDCLFADATAIKTIMRGNPGFMFVRDATVVDKGRRIDDLDMNLETNL